MGNQDVYLNVAGGARISDPGADLAVCLAVASSLRDMPVRPRIALAGEVGLGGEIRNVSHFAKRMKEAISVGFEALAGSASDADASGEGPPGFSHLSSAIEGLLDGKRSGGDWA